MSTLINTPYGHVAFTPTDNSHIYIQIAPTSPDLDAQGNKYPLPFTVRGVSYDGSIHVYRHNDGSFAPGPPSATDYDLRQSIYIKRQNLGRLSNDRASDSAEHTILQTLIPLVNNWATANPYALDAAHQQQLATALARLDQQRTDLLQKLTDLDTQIAALRPR